MLWRATRAPILARGGAHEEAEALAREALRRACETEFIMLRAESLVELAAVLRCAGREGAGAALEEAVAAYGAKGDLVSSARVAALLQAA